MASNPYVNKVEFGNSVLLDLTSDTATADKVLSGYTFHLASGASATGTAVSGSAFIVVTSTAGATLTCGSQTYTLGSDETQHVFEVALGTYTVTATKETLSASDSVNVVTYTVYFTDVPIVKLPTAYQEVEYLMSNTTNGDSGPYIETDSVPSLTKMYEIVLKHKVNNNFMFLLGGAKGSDGFHVYGGDSQGNPELGMGDIIYGVSYDIYTSHTVQFDLANGQILYDGSVAATGMTGSFDSGTDYPLRLFRANRSSYPNWGSGYIYSVKIYDSGVLTNWLIPCYRKSDSVAGMYDRMTDTFYTNQGSGSFVAGGDVN